MQLPQGTWHQTDHALVLTSSDLPLGLVSSSDRLPTAAC